MNPGRLASLATKITVYAQGMEKTLKTSPQRNCIIEIKIFESAQCAESLMKSGVEFPGIHE